ncbi:MULTISPECIES: RNA polymerase sigma factor [Pseudomonas]|uniref:RNA polymerase sigma factor n=4 Tax=Pseudomonas fluorescens group TaxID=136843 RepID=C3K9L7_PSEFS|nr:MULTISPECIES: RNA polymerase sigma factor [Pseudomonas]KJZ52431.1 RNA polymerase sigma factor [Pseudomonas marginalis]KJZ62029.1 RNA polymerase sigma factor [Pseudomonas marginalis]MBZ6459257.1 RNA polymerase sigma factor [Pseudomonas fluorescens group sp.]MBZ6465408.1 RNA polymerase sigma factor [Pseudomonas fluorescens group sp.]MBZ6471409.1 RNA polymerase sigma factor [Pseudomonas fluorescens group sp.]
MKDTDPDVELLARIGNNEPAAVNEMVTRKLPRLLALAGRILGDADEARDVAQESFLRIWRHAASWRSGEARFDTWLHRVALNLCHDRLRRRKERPLAEADTLALADSAPPLDEQLETTERNARMAAALAALPERQREAIVLQYYQELSNIDAAALMNISVEALESLLSRARRQLRSQLADTPGLARPGRGTS